MQIHTAQIVDEPENAPTLLLAKTEEDLFAKLKACPDLKWLARRGLDDCSTVEEIVELYEEEHQEMYAGIFVGVEEL